MPSFLKFLHSANVALENTSDDVCRQIFISFFAQNEVYCCQLNSPAILVHVAFGAGLPSTLHKRVMVAFLFKVKSEFGTVSVIWTGAVEDNKNSNLYKRDLWKCRIPLNECRMQQQP